MSLPLQYTDIPLKGNIYAYRVYRIWASQFGDDTSLWKESIEEIAAANEYKRLNYLFGSLKRTVNKSIQRIKFSHKKYQDPKVLPVPIEGVFFGGIYKLTHDGWQLIRWVDRCGNYGIEL